MQELACSDVLGMVCGESALDVGEPDADAILMSLERCQIDGVGEVGFKQLVALAFELSTLCGEVSNLEIESCHLFVEGRVNLGGKPLEILFTDSDLLISRFNQLLSN
ncbi:hypothetical protein [Leucobacter sp. W1478]|uniref:hypothetical protein n=1 Tax=Leucobacter sp. W1478 TaxID=3439065 RepID=UPI003F3E28DF